MLLNKSFIINELILDSKLARKLLTETWLGTKASVVLTEAYPPNFCFLFSIRGGKRGGGTASFFKNIVMSKEVSFNSCSSFEYHSFVFSSPPIIYISAFRPFHYPTAFIGEFSEL